MQVEAALDAADRIVGEALEAQPVALRARPPDEGRKRERESAGDDQNGRRNEMLAQEARPGSEQIGFPIVQLSRREV